MTNTFEKRAFEHGSKRIGFYGCNNRVIRLELDPPLMPSYPRRVRLMCPACRHEHDARPHWRKTTPALDEGKDPDYVIGRANIPTPKQAKKPARVRRPRDPRRR